MIDTLAFTRRTMIAGLGAAVAAPAFGEVGKTFVSAAVMRVPVLVPTSLASLPDIRRRNAEAMVAAIEGLMRGASPPRLIVFPVLQYVSSKRGEAGIPIDAVAVDLLAEPLDRGLFAPIVEACRRHGCYVATSTQEKTSRLPGRYFHTGFLMGPEGLLLRSPKTQARSAKEISFLRDIKAEYIAAFGPDSILPVVRTPIGTIGCYIEAEAEVLDAARLLASRGAEIIVHPSQEDDETPWLALKQSIAYQCQVFLLTGTTSRTMGAAQSLAGWSGGSATIVAPDGRILAAMGGKDEGAATAALDLDRIAAARTRNGFKTSPAREIYG